MAQSNATQSDLVSFLSQARAQNDYAFSAAALLSYDSILTMPQEIRCVWRRKWSLINTLYFTMRHVTLLALILQCALGTVKFSSATRCSTLSAVYKALNTVSVLSISVFQTYRIWALYQGEWLLIIILFAFSLVMPSVNLYLHTLPTSWNLADLHPSAGCRGIPITFPPQFLLMAARACAIAADFFVLCLTWMKVAKLEKFKRSQKILCQPSIPALLISNGALYFGTLLLSVSPALPGTC
ncbi:hypothetical protein K474DRAFT_1664565 [Panus rudis PR-1116 ss-1]|nr:hypothetical protein K474DRAFT_1664565 [Panus rudis PR-1116 ss-1]